MSDSECDSPVPKKSVTATNRKPKTSTSSTTKRKPATPTNSKCDKKPKTNVFGLYADQEEVAPNHSESSSTRVLPSYLASKVGGGSERRCCPTSGDFYIELKVFAREDATCPEIDERWKKALLRLHCSLEDDSSQWKNLQRFVRDASVIFEDAEPVFFSDKIVVKRPL